MADTSFLVVRAIHDSGSQLRAAFELIYTHHFASCADVGVDLLRRSVCRQVPSTTRLVPVHRKAHDGRAMCLSPDMLVAAPTFGGSMPSPIGALRHCTDLPFFFREHQQSYRRLRTTSGEDKLGVMPKLTSATSHRCCEANDLCRE